MPITAAFIIGAAVLTAPMPSPRPGPAIQTTEQPATGAPMTAPNPPSKPLGPSPQPVPQSTTPTAGTSGSVCGDPRIVGQERPPVLGRGSCGISAPVRITAVAGVTLSTAATVNCRTARVFTDWIVSAAQPAAREIMGSGIRTAHVYASYSCRTRNHRPGARLSEHAFGRAIDIGAFTLTDGEQITVLKGWDNGARGAFLRRVWTKACGPFKTVLGPEADAAHRDHFHFDTALRRNAYCR